MMIQYRASESERKIVMIINGIEYGSGDSVLINKTIHLGDTFMEKMETVLRTIDIKKKFIRLSFSKNNFKLSPNADEYDVTTRILWVNSLKRDIEKLGMEHTNKKE